MNKFRVTVGGDNFLCENSQHLCLAGYNIQKMKIFQNNYFALSNKCLIILTYKMFSLESLPINLLLLFSDKMDELSFGK